MNRREFLAATGGAAMVFGLRELFGQDVKRAAWVGAALARMKETGRFGVVLVVGQSDDERLKLGRALAALLRDESTELRETFCEAVFVCAPAGTFEAAEASHTRILLSPEGKRIESDTIGDAALRDAAGFVASFRPFLRGRDGGRLAGHAAAMEKSVPAAATEALRNLAADDVDRRGSAEEILGGHADKIMPWLCWKRTTEKVVEVREAIGRIIVGQFTASKEDRPGPRLPFGTRIEKEKVREEVDPCPPCGMALPREIEQPVLRFLAG